MRHAKSDWNAEYGSDHDRPLNERGVQSARVMGEVLAAEELVPDLLISSTAVRARTTSELAVEAGDWACHIALDERLYGGGSETVLSVASAAAPNVDRLMLVGHQPTWSMVVSDLTGEQVDMKTAAVAVVQIDLAEWVSLSPQSRGELVSVLQPRDHL